VANLWSRLIARGLLLQVFLERQDIKLGKLRLKALERANLRSKKSVVSGSGPAVSVTTHGARIQTVFFALESIAAGGVLPSRLILWLDDVDAFNSLPDSLRRLQARGLEVRLSANYGPHTKYYPYVLNEDSFDRPLVIADDDVIYSRWWLAGLVRAYQRDPGVVNCYRAHTVKITDGEIALYQTWPHCHSTIPSFRYFATGVSGCIYPPRLLEALKGTGTAFASVCPKADDIWLHVSALRAGFRIRQIFDRQVNFPFVPGTQADGLFQTNVGLSANDAQIKKTYTPEDLKILILRD
jgi:hypothetical protein